MKKSFKSIILLLICIYQSLCYAASVSDNDGSSFITKSEFDALRSSFQSQIDSYTQNIDSKIDTAIASYLAGIRLNNEVELENLYNSYVSNWHVKLKAGKTKPTALDYEIPVNGDLIADSTGILALDDSLFEGEHDIYWTNSKTINNYWSSGYNWTKDIKSNESSFVNKDCCLPLTNMTFEYQNAYSDAAQSHCIKRWLIGPTHAGNIRVVQSVSTSVPCIITNSTWLFYNNVVYNYISGNSAYTSHYGGSYYPDIGGDLGNVGGYSTYSMQNVVEVNNGSIKDNKKEYSRYNANLVSKNIINQNKWVISTVKDLEYYDVPGVGRSKTLWWSRSSTYVSTGSAGLPGFDVTYFGSNINPTASDRPTYDKNKWVVNSIGGSPSIYVHGTMYRAIKRSDLKKSTTNGYCDYDLYNINSNMDNNLKGIIVCKDTKVSGSIKITGTASNLCNIEFYKSNTGAIDRSGITEKVEKTSVNGDFTVEFETDRDEGYIWIFVKPSSSDVKIDISRIVKTVEV